MEFRRLDIVQLIHNSPLTKLSNEFRSKLLNKIQESFTNDQQQLFVASFYTYLNYNSKTDFVINLDDVWKWCGFTRRDNARRILDKNFTKDIDYKIFAPQVGGAKFVLEVAGAGPSTYNLGEEKAAPQVGGAGPSTYNLGKEKAAPQVGGAGPSTRNLGGAGLNKETILMTINTFKKFCLKAGTKKADEIHDYYIKLEELMQDTLKEESKELRLILKEKETQLDTVKKDSIKHKHNMLLREYNYECNLIYLIKVKTFENTHVIKIGESRMGILNRWKEHKSKYPECLILDCFLVKRSKQFEKFLHSQLNKYMYKKLPGHENENELFLVGEELSYSYILKLINDNIKAYDDDQLEINKYKLEIQKLKLENENLSLQRNDTNQFNYNRLLNDIREIVKEEVSKLHIQNVTNNFGEPLNTLSPYVQQLNPDTLTLTKIFQNISEVCKTYKIPRSSLVKAAKENTVYCNYRWNLVDRERDPKIVENIQPTKVLKKVQNLGYIAKLNKDKNEILNVYLDRKTASLKNGYQSVGFLDPYVKQCKEIDEHYYILYENCENTLKNNFLKKKNLSNVVLYKNGGVGQYDLNNNLINEFRSKYDCQTTLQIGNKSLCKALETGKPYDKFYFKYLNDKLFI